LELSQNPLVKNVIQEQYLVNSISDYLPNCFVDFGTNARDFPPVSTGGDTEQHILDCSHPEPGAQQDCIDNWGLDRLDRASLLDAPRDESFSYRQSASNVRVFVLDTGVEGANREFENENEISRVTLGFDTTCEIYPQCDPVSGPCEQDWEGNGHGTHVAAIIGGRTFGLARDVEIMPIRTLCDEYSTEHYKIALDMVHDIHSPFSPTAVVNISGMNNTGCIYDPNCSAGAQVREAMIEVAERNNLLIVQSSGNKTDVAGQTDIDACNRSFGDEDRYADPASMARIMVVAGSDEADNRFATVTGEVGHPTESTIGTCVDLFAPATDIVSAFAPDNEDPEEIVCRLSGTSMAAPHVSGVAAMILSEYPGLNVDQLRRMIMNWAEVGSLGANIGTGSPNLLLHWDPSNIMKDGFEGPSTMLWTIVIE